MSLPTTIRFVDADLKTISDEFYNCGWWVPDSLGKDIADLYSEEEWVFVAAYDRVFDRTGKLVGQVNYRFDSWYIYDEADYEIIEFLKEENRKDVKRKEVLRRLRQGEALEKLKRAEADKIEQLKLQGWSQEQIDERLEAERIERERIKVLIPMIRKVMPGAIASTLVGVQPMTGEGTTESLFSFKYIEGDDLPKKLYFKHKKEQ